MISLSTLLFLATLYCCLYPLWGRTSHNFSVTFSPDFPILLTLCLALEPFTTNLLHLLVSRDSTSVLHHSRAYPFQNLQPHCSAYLLSDTRKVSTTDFLRSAYLISCWTQFTFSRFLTHAQ